MRFFRAVNRDRRAIALLIRCAVVLWFLGQKRKKCISVVPHLPRDVAEDTPSDGGSYPYRGPLSPRQSIDVPGTPTAQGRLNFGLKKKMLKNGFLFLVSVPWVWILNRFFANKRYLHLGTVKSVVRWKRQVTWTTWIRDPTIQTRFRFFRFAQQTLAVSMDSASD